MWPIRNREGAYLVIVQNDTKILDHIRSNLDSHSPNHVVFTREPQDALFEVLLSPVDAVVTGQRFYDTSLESLAEMFVLLKRGLREGLQSIAGDLAAVIKDKEQGPKSGTELASYIHRLNPDVLVFRYSLMPEEAGELVGDIDKTFLRDDEIFRLINNRELGSILRDRNKTRLMEAFPRIQFYDQTLMERLRDKFVAPSTADALDFYVSRYVDSAVLAHRKNSEKDFKSLSNVCGYAANMFTSGLERQVALEIPSMEGITDDDLRNMADVGLKAKWSNPVAIAAIQSRYLQLRPQRREGLVLLS